MATNSFPDVCEFKARIETSSKDETECFVYKSDLGVHDGEIFLGDEECKISFKKITISADLEGFVILNGTRFGEPIKTNIQSTVQCSQPDVTTTSLALGAKCETDGSVMPLISYQKTKQTQSTNDEEYHIRVRACPNDRWEVSEAEDEALRGTYLSDQALFMCTVQEGSNRNAISAELKVKQRDIDIDQAIASEASINFFERFKGNKRKFLDIFIAKSLTESAYGKGSYRGEIKLSEFIEEVTLEDSDFYKELGHEE